MGFFKTKINASEAALADLQTRFASLTEEHEALKAELLGAQEETKAAQESAATFLAEFTRTDALAKEQAATIEALNVSLAEASRDAAEFDSKVAATAAHEVAAMGHAPLEIVEEEEAAPDLIKTFKGLKGRELVEFYAANKQEIARALKAG
ncbi:hypothetical protein [Haloferula sp. BvORR071]|uniref:hypothetical protein n=1 Tax=Haloferula sp. BvORR071 TaxID=1396141 RepID=UPI000555DAA2|nr:hypothetical protein [Haloferula sp. BvORR071]